MLHSQVSPLRDLAAEPHRALCLLRLTADDVARQPSSGSQNRGVRAKGRSLNDSLDSLCEISALDGTLSRSQLEALSRTLLAAQEEVRREIAR